MKLRNAVLVGVVLAMATTIPTVQATLLSDLTNPDGTAKAGAYLTVDDKIFTGINYVNGGISGFDPTKITVSTSEVNGVDYLDFTGPILVNNIVGAGYLLGDLKIGYTVTATAGSIVMIDQNYTPNAVNVANSQIIIGETARDSVNNNTYISTLTLNPVDLADPVAEPGDNLNIPGGSQQLIVVKDISIAAAAGELVGLSDVEQSFHQVPEPTTVIAGALLLLPLGASTLRILRRNRIS